MAKATHRGHCQVCGALQKLPGGRLAKHGYTVEWQTFWGTCSGSGHLPFEQDTSLIEEAIERAREREATLRALVERIESDPTYDLLHRRDYSRKGNPWVAAPYEWRRNEQGRIEFRVGDRWHSLLRYGVYTDDPAAALVELNRSYRHALLSQADGARVYQHWQRDRIANWTPGELIPVEE